CARCGRTNPAGANFCNGCAAPLPDPEQHELRKVVTIVRIDLVGSTALGEALDPESLRSVLGRYFDVMKEIVERHGGTVEKFIGDAVMSVFGIPALHEDDALRAVHAALEMRDALVGLELQGRLGVMTGAVIAGHDEQLATGDAVNVVARLEQAAAAGEILGSAPTSEPVRSPVPVASLHPFFTNGHIRAAPPAPLCPLP